MIVEEITSETNNQIGEPNPQIKESDFPQELKDLGNQSIFSPEISSIIVDYYKDRKVIVLDRIGVLRRMDHGLNPMALEALELLKEQNYSIVIWSRDSNRKVKKTAKKLQSALGQNFLDDILIIGGENYSLDWPNNQVNIEDFRHALDLAVNQERITQAEHQEIEATERIHDFVNYTKPHFLFFPEGTRLIDDDGSTLIGTIAGDLVKEEYRDQYPPHGRFGGLLNHTGIGLLKRYPIIPIKSVYSQDNLDKKEELIFSAKFLQKVGILQKAEILQ